MIAPTTEAELSDFLSEASEPVRIVGGGTRQNLGNSVKAKKKLTTAGLTGITLLEPCCTNTGCALWHSIKGGSKSFK
jgi:hypothetical protein